MKPKIFNFKALPFERRAEILEQIRARKDCADMRHFKEVTRQLRNKEKERALALLRVRVRCASYILQKRGLLAAA